MFGKILYLWLRNHFWLFLNNHYQVNYRPLWYCMRPKAWQLLGFAKISDKWSLFNTFQVFWVCKGSLRIQDFWWKCEKFLPSHLIQFSRFPTGEPAFLVKYLLSKFKCIYKGKMKNANLSICLFSFYLIGKSLHFKALLKKTKYWL